MLLCLLHVLGASHEYRSRADRRLEREGFQAPAPAGICPRPRSTKKPIRRGEGLIAADGPLVCRTGQHTGRSPNDKFVVREPSSEQDIAWGAVNRPMEPAQFDALHRDLLALARRARSCSSWTASPAPTRSTGCRSASSPSTPGTACSRATSSSTIRPRRSRGVAAVHGHRRAELQGRSGAPRHALRRRHRAELREAAGAHRAARATPARSRSRSSRVLNYLLPLQRRAADALLGQRRRRRATSALFFGLSGTGKTTLSSDPERAADRRRRARLERSRRLQLRGRLLREDDPAVGRGRAADLRDDAPLRHGARERRRRSGRRARSIWTTTGCTENTRAAYPISFIDNAVPSGQGGHPQNIVMLTADAFGVLPPIARLTPDGAMYHFLSGYTAKVAGTEKGVTEPKATFSTCFGAPFLPLPPEPLRDDARRAASRGTRRGSGWSTPAGPAGRTASARG